MLCIILSFNGCDDTLACIESIVSQKQDNLHILVVDNCSAAGVVDALRSAYPAVELIALPENLGWAGGNNHGIHIGLERGYEWICLLNNDTVFPSGEVGNWLKAIKGLPPCLLHPTIYFWDQPELAQLDPRSQPHFPPGKAPPDWHGKMSIASAYGACLAVHRDIFVSVGVFDERLFLQLEETDFYFRASKVGFKAVCDPSVKIFHKESVGFGGKRAAIKVYYTVRNTLLLIEKKQESFRLKMQSFKELYWTMQGIAKIDENRDLMSHGRFFSWLLSGAPAALAMRLGIRDYLVRSFGKISAVAHSKIKFSEGKRLEDNGHRNQ